MRSLWKGPFIDKLFIRKKQHSLKEKNNHLVFKQGKDLLRSRRSTILPFFENSDCKIYNGNKYLWLSVKTYHIGFKFGDFILTKKRCRPKAKK